MRVFLSNRAQKSLDRMNEPDKSLLLDALEKLSAEPPKGDIKRMKGRNDYRLRKSDIRVLFQIKDNQIFVTNIERRGQIYKGKGKHK